MESHGIVARLARNWRAAGGFRTVPGKCRPPRRHFILAGNGARRILAVVDSDGPDDLEVARQILAAERRDGVPFPVAWERALGALPEVERNGKPRTGAQQDRSVTVAVLRRTEAAWRAAYEGTAPPSAEALRHS
jgi:hypothetical protein